MHFVCTLEEAAKLIADRDHFWVSNCGCREGKGKCSRSRIDLCLMFRGESVGSGSDLHPLERAEVEEILKESRQKYLVARPFRNEKDSSIIDGICFCCDDCCEYFTKPDEKCDKGVETEKTDLDFCLDCGNCAEVCYFDARIMEKSRLVLDRQKCFGCGLCVYVCPEKSIRMVSAK